MAGKYKARRRWLLPILQSLVLPLTEEPDLYSLGERPAYAATCFAFSKLVTSGNSASINAAVFSPIPGIGHYALIAPDVRPSTKYFIAKKKSTKSGRQAITYPAIRTP